MKAAYILESFPNISTTFVLNEIVAMQDRGVNVEVFAFFNPNEKVRHSRINSVKGVYYFNSNSRRYLKAILSHFYWFFRKPFRYTLTAFSTLLPKSGIFKLFVSSLANVRMVDSHKPDLLHAHFGRRPADFCMLVNMLTGIPFTFTTHGYDVHRQPAVNYRFKSLLSQRHITISEFNRRVLIDEHKVPEAKIAVIRCGVDFGRPLPAARPGRDNLIVSVARLQYIKGLDILINACKRLSDENIDFNCVIIGEGPERHSLESLIEGLGLRCKVTMPGALPHEDVFGYLKKARLMVLPSRSESLSVALMEAMACRVPVIGPDIMGNPELVRDGFSGFLVKPGDIEGLTEKMKRLLTDKSLRRRFTEAAYEKVYSDFNIQKETEKLFKVWQECRNLYYG
ncbi:MAG: glycosyltransferase [Candidatus Omnitrophica bacterium]|nr:glycosyltransferase [Candidatus Omnitrophota bacterium]MDD5552968.1 glycosyltransferase [Candidatus Omnitrophota bacterium]